MKLVIDAYKTTERKPPENYKLFGWCDNNKVWLEGMFTRKNVRHEHNQHNFAQFVPVDNQFEYNRGDFTRFNITYWTLLTDIPEPVTIGIKTEIV